MEIPDGSDGKESAYSAGDPSLNPRLGRYPAKGNGCHTQQQQQQSQDQNQDNKEQNQDKQDQQDNQNQQGEDKQDQQQPQNQDGKEEQQQGEQPQEGAMTPEQQEALLQAIQAEEDKTQDKLKEKAGVLIRGSKNW